MSEVEERISALEAEDRRLGSEVRRLADRYDQRGEILERLASQVGEIHRALFEGDERGGFRARLTAVELKAAVIAEVARRVDLLEARTGIAGRLVWIIVAATVGFLGWVARGL